MSIEFQQDSLPFEKEASFECAQHLFLTDTSGKVHQLTVESAMQASRHGIEYAKTYARSIMARPLPFSPYASGMPPDRQRLQFAPSVDIEGAAQILAQDKAALAEMVGQHLLPPSDSEGKWDTTALVCYRFNPAAGLEMFEEQRAADSTSNQS